MQVSTIFFDLDETVYPTSAGVWTLVGERINLYMRDRLGLPEAEISDLRLALYHQYGTTLLGLVATRGIDAEDYLTYVHDVPVARVLGPNPALRRVILSYPQRRLIFTNSDANYAQRVLDVVGIGDCFEKIIDIRQIAPTCKPHPEAFQKALVIAGGLDPHECVLVDDDPRNIHTAAELGFTAIQVDESGTRSDGNLSIHCLQDLPTVLSSTGLPLYASNG
jgi:putative hydrolase of the HAD superfamily